MKLHAFVRGGVDSPLCLPEYYVLSLSLTIQSRVNLLFFTTKFIGNSKQSFNHRLSEICVDLRVFSSSLSSWWLNQPNWKNMLVKMGIFPK